jgi:hypothetical protein
VGSPVVTRLIGLALVLLNVALFARLVNRLTGSTSWGLLVWLFMPVLFQFRLGHDPILCFTFLVQVLMLYVTCSLLCLVRALKGEGKGWQWVGVGCYLAALLTYEVSYPFFLLHAAVALCWRGGDGWRQRARLLAPYALVPVLLAAVLIGMRLFFKVPFLSGAGKPETESFTYGIHFNVIPLLRLLTQQTTSALPLSYFLMGAHKAGLQPISYVAANWVQFAVVPGVAFLLVTFSLVRGAWRRGGEEPPAGLVPGLGHSGLFAFGLSLMVLPGLVMSLSPKYQFEMTWGAGYIPVYLSCFGTAVVLVAAARLLTPVLCRLRPAGAAAAAALTAMALGATSTLQYGLNRLVVEQYNCDWLYPRQLVEEGLRHGLKYRLPEGSRVILGGNHLWAVYPGMPLAFFHIHARTVAQATGRSSYLALADGPGLASRCRRPSPEQLEGRFAAEDAVYYLDGQAHGRAEGHLVLGRLRALSASGLRVAGAAADQAYLYTRLPPAHELRNQVHGSEVEGRWLDRTTLQPRGYFSLPLASLRTVAGDDCWGLYELPASEHLIDLCALRVRWWPSDASDSSLHWSGRSASPVSR